MNPDQLQRLLDRMAEARQPDERLSPERVFLRGFNSALDNVEKWIKEILQEASS